jgi:hypothetical protein
LDIGAYQHGTHSPETLLQFQAARKTGWLREKTVLPFCGHVMIQPLLKNEPDTHLFGEQGSLV